MMEFDYERDLLEQAAAINAAAEKSVQAKLNTVWNDVTALKEAIDNCPHCIAKVFAADRLRMCGALPQLNYPSRNSSTTSNCD
jgi:hypothetical protein